MNAQKPPTSEPGASDGLTACFKAARLDVWPLIGFGCVAVFLVMSGVAAAHTSAVEIGMLQSPSEGNCHIADENPVRVRIRAGEKAWTVCVNSKVWVLIARQPDAAQDDPPRMSRRRSGNESSAITVHGVQAKGDNSAASAIWPIVPDQNECQVAPQPSVPPADGPVQGLVSPFEIGPSVPANPAMVAAVIGLLREAVACANANDLVRLSALYTDDAAPHAVARGFAPFLQALPAQPHPTNDTPATSGVEPLDSIATAQSSHGFTVSQLRQLPMGQIIALVRRVDLDGNEQQNIIVLAFADNRLLFADVIEEPASETPAP